LEIWFDFDAGFINWAVKSNAGREVILNKYFVLKLVLLLGLMDLLSIVYLMVFYVTSIDLTFLININFFLLLFVLVLGAFGADFRVLIRSKFNFLFLALFVISVIKLYFSALESDDLSVYFIFTYFYTLAMVLAALLFVSRFHAEDYDDVFRLFYRFAKLYLIIAVVLILCYSFLYFTGSIYYFGLGTNIHYAVPFFVRNGYGLFIVLLSVVALSGKRAVMVNFLVQYGAFYFDRYRRHKIILISLVSSLAVVAYFLITETNLLYRFQAVFAVDWQDETSLVAAFGGRFEELVGIVNYFEMHPLNFFFGAPPGDFYMYVASTGLYDYNDPKNFSHVGPFAFLFRYGLVFTALFYLYGLYLLFKYFDPKFPFYLVFVGILSSSFFGANLFSDPMAWVFIGFFLKYRHVSLNLKKSLR
jgi:hypothetical protein